MLRRLLIALAGLVAVLVVVVAMQPADFRVARSTTIAAPPAAVFVQVNDLHAFQEWNPWAKRDPAMKPAYEGPPSGKGAIYRWAGNSEVEEGIRPW